MKQSAVLLLIIFLASCTTPQRTAAPVNADVVAALANVTQTAASGTMMADRVNRESEQSTKQASINATATQGAYIATATQSVIGTQVAIVAATATHHAETIEEIEAEALRTRRHAETVATIAHINVESTREHDAVNRAEWTANVRNGFLLFGLFVLICTGGVALLNAGSAIGREDEIVTIIEQPQALLPEPEAPRAWAVRNRGGFVAVEETRKPFDLTGRDGSLVAQFTSRILDDMQTNIENGDRGFRRDSSANKLGMDKLAGLNGNGYKNVLDAMRVHGFVELDGGNNRWTTHGVVTVLGMDSLPQS